MTIVLQDSYFVALSPAHACIIFKVILLDLNGLSIGMIDQSKIQSAKNKSRNNYNWWLSINSLLPIAYTIAYSSAQVRN